MSVNRNPGLRTFPEDKDEEGLGITARLCRLCRDNLAVCPVPDRGAQTDSVSNPTSAWKSGYGDGLTVNAITSGQE